MQYFLICLEPENEEGMDQQQELLTKLIMFCVQDDGKRRPKWVRFHFQVQSLRGFAIHPEIAPRTFSFGGNSAKVQPGFPFCVLTTS